MTLPTWMNPNAPTIDALLETCKRADIAPLINQYAHRMNGLWRIETNRITWREAVQLMLVLSDAVPGASEIIDIKWYIKPEPFVECFSDVQTEEGELAA